MKKTIFLVFSLILFLSTGCQVQRSDNTTTNSMSHNDDIVESSATSDVTECENDMFNRRYNTNSEQADAVFQSIVSSIEGRDAPALKALFSEYATSACKNMDEQIMCLFDFYEGEMLSFSRYGPGSHSAKEENVYVKEIFASYDVQTTSGEYRIAVKFCTIDASNPENIGLRSIYIIKGEDSNPDYAYWGGDSWDPGINIEG